MVLELLVNLFTSLVELLRISIIVSIPMLACAVIIKNINSRLSGRFGFGFAKASFFSTYLVVLALIIVLYFFPIYQGFTDSEITSQVKPPQIAITAFDYLSALPFFAVKLLLYALILTILIMPIEFIAAYVFETAKNITKSGILRLFISCYVASIATVLIVLFVFPFAVTGLIYGLYFA